MQRNITQPQKRNEILPFATTWMDLEGYAEWTKSDKDNILLTDWCNATYDKYHLHMETKKMKTKEVSQQNKERAHRRGNRLAVTSGEGDRRGGGAVQTVTRETRCEEALCGEHSHALRWLNGARPVELGSPAPRTCGLHNTRHQADSS